jgi:hypothetical protein
MAVLTDFDIATDLKVEMLLPQDVNNVFVLGVSVLGGTDVLGEDSSGTLAWQDLACEVNRVQTTLGGSIASNVYFQADAGKANIQLQSWEFDPNNYTYIRPGTQVRVRISRGEYSFVLWHGTVDNINVAYAPDQQNQISIEATDFWALLVNRRFDYDPAVDYITPSQAIGVAVDQVAATGFTIPYGGPTILPEWFMTGTPSENTTFGAVAANCLTTGLGFIWINPNTGYLEYRPRANSGVPVYDVGNNHGDPYHLCMADISVTTQSDDIYNTVLVTQKFEYLADPLFTQLYVDSDSIDLYGQRSSDFTVDLKTVDDAAAWAAAVFAPKPITHVQDVTTPAIDRSRNLTQAVEFMPGDYVGVIYQTDNINIDQNYTVTKVSHSIDVNNWFTTLETWKEF